MADDAPPTRTDAAPAGDPERPAASGPPAREERVYRGTGISIGAIVAVLVTVALIIFIAQNTGSVEMEWLTVDFRWPLAAVMLATLAAGVVLAGIGGFIWRHRRRSRLRQREELRQLRAEKGEPEKRGLLRR